MHDNRRPPWNNKERIDNVLDLIFNKGYQGLQRLCQHPSFIKIICQAQELCLSEEVNRFREKPSEDTVISLIMENYLTMCALELLKSRHIKTKLTVTPLLDTAPEITFLEIYAYHMIQNNSLPCLPPGLNLADLSYFGLEQAVSSYTFSHPLLRDYYCARYFVTCLIQEPNEGHNKFFPSYYNWQHDKYTINQFITKNSHNEQLQRVWHYVVVNGN